MPSCPFCVLSGMHETARSHLSSKNLAEEMAGAQVELENGFFLSSERAAGGALDGIMNRASRQQVSFPGPVLSN